MQRRSESQRHECQVSQAVTARPIWQKCAAVVAAAWFALATPSKLRFAPFFLAHQNAVFFWRSACCTSCSPCWPCCSALIYDPKCLFAGRVRKLASPRFMGTPRQTARSFFSRRWIKCTNKLESLGQVSWVAESWRLPEMPQDTRQ